MIESQSPVVQALLGTLFTWGLTFLGAAMAVFIQGHQRRLLDISLGFAAGVMLAASYWSLLEPALTFWISSSLMSSALCVSLTQPWPRNSSITF